MTFPSVTAITAGLILLMQMALAFTVSGSRGKVDTWVGDGGHAGLLRLTRRHANLAENAGIFMVGFALLEVSRLEPRLLLVLCAAFLASRVLHALGLSRVQTRNSLRLAGGLGTYLTGIVLAVALVWAGVVGLGWGHA